MEGKKERKEEKFLKYEIMEEAKKTKSRAYEIRKKRARISVV